MKPKILVIAGPTASGKTKIAVELAKVLNGEIISADSMQIYKNMDIGTAKPTEEEKQGIPHYMMDFLEIGEPFSVAEYVEMASKFAEDVLSRGKVPIFCGGTGLYINSIVEEIKYGDTEGKSEIRQELEDIAKREGNSILYEELKIIDTEAADRIHINDTKRIIRAIEVYKLLGITITEQQLTSKEKEKNYDYKIIGLNISREKLYERINLRVDKMIEQGLPKEAEKIISKLKFEKKITSFQAIGYKEFIPYFNGICSMEEAIEKVKQESRRYAKRQITWFKRTPGIIWIDAENEMNYVISEIQKIYEN